jgi:lysozyme family protein
VTHFDRCLAFVLEEEGGYSDQSWDNGGPTNMGISKRSYPDEDIAHLTVGRVTAIYFRDFWTPAKCDLFPPAIGLWLLDTGILSGPGTAVRMLQRELKVVPDGVVGPKTVTAAGERDAIKLLEAVLARRCFRNAYNDGWNEDFREAGMNWLGRAFRLHRLALTL